MGRSNRLSRPRQGLQSQKLKATSNPAPNLQAAGWWGLGGMGKAFPYPAVAGYCFAHGLPDGAGPEPKGRHELVRHAVTGSGIHHSPHTRPAFALGRRLRGFPFVTP